MSKLPDGVTINGDTVYSTTTHQVLGFAQRNRWIPRWWEAYTAKEQLLGSDYPTRRAAIDALVEHAGEEERSA